ncbi:Mss4-like protein [Infundibulicybe gibba]|nr:Mss4-like protein [Infundibulicybe gibba]
MGPRTGSEAKMRYGSCLCQAIKYKVTGPPFMLVVCHCDNCQKATGSAFMTNAFFKAKYVVLLKGEEHIKQYKDPGTRSGNPIFRSFCSQCGSCIFLGGGGREYKMVAAGTLDDSSDWVPRMENLPEYRRTWLHDIGLQPNFRYKL